MEKCFMIDAMYSQKSSRQISSEVVKKFAYKGCDKLRFTVNNTQSRPTSGVAAADLKCCWDFSNLLLLKHCRKMPQINSGFRKCDIYFYTMIYAYVMESSA